MISIFALLFNQSVQGQKIIPEVVCMLPDEIRENSGMVVLNDSLILFHNDSGHEPCVYLVDDQCKLLKKSCITNAQNTDWEDATIDAKGNIYIADMGNNKNNRKTVHIYKFHQDQLADELTEITAERIEVTYSAEFPAIDLMYDVESIYWHNDSLYFLSKNRRVPFDGISWIFAVPDKAGIYKNISPIDSISIPGISRYTSWVTSVDYESASGVLLVLGQNKITAFSKSEFDYAPWRGEQTLISFDHFSQKEAIAFGNAYVYISDEAYPNLPGQQLYRFPKTLLYDILGLDIHLLPIDYNVKTAHKEISDTLDITFTLPFKTKVGFEIFDTDGQRIMVGSSSTYNKGFHRLKIDVSPLMPALYVVNIIIDEQPNALIFKRVRSEDEPLDKFYKKP
ncbi:MAG: hypothetical protein LAT54_05380 [Cryomorphaceae bacterium]|nr:hypothetical protein [Cryomorphaceae bacterium]